MIPWLYEILAYSKTDKDPDYKGIVMASTEDEARDKVENWYTVRHAGEIPAWITIHETIT
jgi:hypothetical protein